LNLYLASFQTNYSSVINPRQRWAQCMRKSASKLRKNVKTSEIFV